MAGVVISSASPDRVKFGSTARGEAGPDSDIDLLVVFDDDAPLESLSARAAYEARAGYHGPVDIIPCPHPFCWRP